MLRKTARYALFLPLFAALCVPSAAHVTLEKTDAAQNAGYKAVLRVGHGCAGGAGTTALEVTIPEGIIGAKPMPKPGWSVRTTKGAYAKPYAYYHAPVSEGVKTITWSGGTLPDDQYDEFVFDAYVSDGVAPGSTVYFPVVQTCTTGAHNWTQIPGPGESAHALKEPAPGLRIMQVAAAMTDVVKAGTLEIATPWLRATPGGAKVAGGYLRITNTGDVADRLTAASIPLASRGEVHEMSMQDGVMRMRQLESGLTIAPHQSVELKPGGYHLMFMDLNGALTQGQTLKGTLTFEKAGTVAVEFSVGGIASTKPPESEMHMHMD